MQTASFFTHVSGMTCRPCEDSILEALISVRGVLNAEVSYWNATVQITYDPEIVSEQFLQDVLAQTGPPMNLNRPDMTEDVKYKDYTNKLLQKDSTTTTMEVVTQTNAVKSPTDSPKTTKLVYTVEEIARMLAISLRSAYNLCNSTTEFRVLRVGGSIRVPKDSFDAWLNRAA